MDQDHRTGEGGESAGGGSSGVADARALAVLHRYATGELSAREAARAMGPDATEHDVFAGVADAGLPLPVPGDDELAQQVADLCRLYGPHGRPGGGLPPADH